jgi:hypothetical protein
MSRDEAKAVADRAKTTGGGKRDADNAMITFAQILADGIVDFAPANSTIFVWMARRSPEPP